jgi:hypothetical protein
MHIDDNRTNNAQHIFRNDENNGEDCRNPQNRA